MMGTDSEVQTASFELSQLSKTDTARLKLTIFYPSRCRGALLDKQVLDFYWIDPIEAAKLFISRPKFKGKLYTQYKRQNSTQRPGKRAFGRATSGLVFQACQAVDRYSSPLLLLFYVDESFSGKHRTHHPIYSKCCLHFKLMTNSI
jgi:hypothetical protein